MLQGFYWDVPVDADIVLNHIYGGEDNLEPNNGQGTFQDFPSSGQTLRAFIQDEHDVDVFKVSVPGGQDLVFRLSPRFSHETGWWSGDPTHGYYPFELWYEGEDLAPTHLQADGRVYVQAPSRSFAVYVPQKDLSRP
jgi:alpha-amylase